MTPPHYVLTGAPSSGKSTLLHELAHRGYKTLDETATRIIEEETSAGTDYKQLRASAYDFQHRILRMQLEREAALPKDELIILDRAIPDSIAFYKRQNVPLDDELREACAAARYRRVFILDLISRENYLNDESRWETWEDVQELDRMLEAAYVDLGHEVVRVPPVSVPERVDFVLARLD